MVKPFLVENFELWGEGGQVVVEQNKIVFGRGEPFTGIVIDDKNFKPPSDEYEINLRARKTEGRDFFAL